MGDQAPTCDFLIIGGGVIGLSIARELQKRKLEMDFVLEGDRRSMHMLNAVSPAFTCSLPFASYVCDHIEKAIG